MIKVVAAQNIERGMLIGPETNSFFDYNLFLVEDISQDSPFYFHFRIKDIYSGHIEWIRAEIESTIKVYGILTPLPEALTHQHTNSQTS